MTSSGNQLDSLLDRRFGRCAYFALYDTESGKVEFVSNTGKDAVEGAGPAAVALIANRKAEKVISGEFGFKIKGMLDDLKIQMVVMAEDKTIGELIALLAN